VESKNGMLDQDGSIGPYFNPSLLRGCEWRFPLLIDLILAQLDITSFMGRFHLFSVAKCGEMECGAATIAKPLWTEAEAGARGSTDIPLRPKLVILSVANSRNI